MENKKKKERRIFGNNELERKIYLSDDLKWYKNPKNIVALVFVLSLLLLGIFKGANFLWEKIVLFWPL